MKRYLAFALALLLCALVLSPLVAHSEPMKLKLEDLTTKGPWIDIRWYLPAGYSSSVAYTSQVQAAVIASEDSGKPLFVPIQIKIDNTITLRGSKHMTMFGYNVNISGFIMMGNTVNAMFAGDGVQNSRPTFKDIFFSGEGLANYGLYLPNTNTAIFNHVKVLKTTVAGAFVSYGWSNVFFESEFSSNYGHGLVLDNNVNAVVLVGNQIFSNDGIGLVANGGSNISLYGNVIESNKKAGFLFNNMNSVVLDGNYYESNGTVGLPFTTPAITASVSGGIFNGSSNYDNTLGSTNPNKVVNISGEVHSITGLNKAGYMFASADGVDISTIYGNVPTLPLLWIYDDAAYSSVKNIKIGPNKGFSSVPYITGTTVAQDSNLASIEDFSVRPSNYISDNFLLWGVIDNVDGGTFYRSSLMYNGFDTFKLSGALNTDAYGKTISIADYPYLASKEVYFGMWSKVSSRGGNLVLSADNNTSSIDPALTTEWNWKSVKKTMPSSGSVSFSIKNITSSSQTTNMALQSEVMTDGPTWSYFGESLINQDNTTAPDGALTAEKVTENSSTSEHGLNQAGITRSAGALPYTATVYIKPLVRDHVRLTVYDGSGTYYAYRNFNLDNNTSTIYSGAGHGFTIASASDWEIVDVENGFKRLSFTFLTDAISTNFGMYIYSMSSGTGAASYLGDGSGMFYVWGAQIEQGENFSFYVPTTTAQVTASDNAFTAYVANPVLAVVGAHEKNLYPTKRHPDWAAAAAPAGGTWDNGTTVRNTGGDSVVLWKYNGTTWDSLSTP